MRTDLRCTRCSTRLAAKVSLQGKKVRCPKCRQPVRVPFSPMVLPPVSAPGQGAPLMAIPVTDDEPELAEVLPDDAELGDFEVLPDEAPVSPPSPPTPRPVKAQVIESPQKEPTPIPKKKKKKKKLKTKESERLPLWMWIAGGLGALVTTGGLVFGLIMMMRVGTRDGDPIDWAQQLTVFAISVPITLVILVASMFISSALGGGINFGDAKTAIIGSLFLVFLVNLVRMIPIIGPYLTLLVWLVGFMTIFGLDPWEARFLLVINWILNFALGMFIIKLLDDDLVGPRKKDPDLEIEEFELDPRGGEWKRVPPMKDDDGDDQSYLQPGRWHEQMRGWVGRQVA